MLEHMEAKSNIFPPRTEVLPFIHTTYLFLELLSLILGYNMGFTVSEWELMLTIHAFKVPGKDILHQMI